MPALRIPPHSHRESSHRVSHAGHVTLCPSGPPPTSWHRTAHGVQNVIFACWALLLSLSRARHKTSHQYHTTQRSITHIRYRRISPYGPSSHIHYLRSWSRDSAVQQAAKSTQQKQSNGAGNCSSQAGVLIDCYCYSLAVHTHSSIVESKSDETTRQQNSYAKRAQQSVKKKNGTGISEWRFHQTSTARGAAEHSQSEQRDARKCRTQNEAFGNNRG